MVRQIHLIQESTHIVHAVLQSLLFQPIPMPTSQPTTANLEVLVATSEVRARRRDRCVARHTIDEGFVQSSTIITAVSYDST